MNSRRRSIVHCIEGTCVVGCRAARLGGLAALMAAAALLAGCASPRPGPAASPPPAPAPAVPVRPAAAPAPAPAAAPAPAPTPAPAPAVGVPDLGPRVALPAPVAARNMDEFRRQAARRMVAANPQFTYMGKPPPMMFAIAILEIEVNADGSVRQISVTRPPANPVAASTIDVAKEAIRRGAPYGDMARLPRPWKWSEVFLFNDKSQFKPRTLD